MNIDYLVNSFGIDKDKLERILLRKPNESNLDDYNEFKNLMDTIDKDKVLDYFKNDNPNIQYFEARIEAEDIIKNYILYGILKKIIKE